MVDCVALWRKWDVWNLSSALSLNRPAPLPGCCHSPYPQQSSVRPNAAEGAPARGSASARRVAGPRPARPQAPRGHRNGMARRILPAQCGTGAHARARQNHAQRTGRKQTAHTAAVAGNPLGYLARCLRVDVNGVLGVRGVGGVGHIRPALYFGCPGTLQFAAARHAPYQHRNTP